MSKESHTTEGVRVAWDFWLSQHDVSVPAIIEVAVRAAVREWMDAHGEEIVALAVRAALASSLASLGAGLEAEQEREREEAQA